MFFPGYLGLPEYPSHSFCVPFSFPPPNFLRMKTVIVALSTLSLLQFAVAQPQGGTIFPSPPSANTNLAHHFKAIDAFTGEVVW